MDKSAYRLLAFYLTKGRNDPGMKGIENEFRLVQKIDGFIMNLPGSYILERVVERCYRQYENEK